jgi:hypothetical protein
MDRSIARAVVAKVLALEEETDYFRTSQWRPLARTRLVDGGEARCDGWAICNRVLLRQSWHLIMVDWLAFLHVMRWSTGLLTRRHGFSLLMSSGKAVRSRVRRAKCWL